MLAVCVSCSGAGVEEDEDVVVVDGLEVNVKALVLGPMLCVVGVGLTVAGVGVDVGLAVGDGLGVVEVLSLPLSASDCEAEEVELLEPVCW